ncbi:glycosyltransferase family 4 protein [Thermus sp.]|uniref:glycosyltransferase family 4 protein n=1 Tax=Thermus sp. TaxID=275 RepID=UPI003D12409F
MRLKVLLSAYACEPGKGSEPGVGWNLARHLAEHHEVWVLTRANNRPAIEAELARNPVPRLRFVYHDLPSWARFWKRGQRGVQLYYYFWQLTAIPLVRRLHRDVGFDVVQHVTFVKYWAPSALAFLKGVPFVWGPVGGGESSPLAFWPTLGFRGAHYEVARTLARALGELDPLVRLTARRAALALATTPDTAARLARLGARRIEVVSEAALSEEEIEALGGLPSPEPGLVRFLSVGRLLAWKGFHLGLMAFARSGLEDAEYWIVGDGPERRRLEALARRLGVAERVHFWGKLPRSEVLSLLAQVHALVHPSLHDSGGWVCLEAMAAGRPVICLDLGGPGVQVTEEAGFKVPPETPEPAVEGLARAMRALADPLEVQRFSKAARERVWDEFLWAKKVERINVFYASLEDQGSAIPD